MNYCPKCGYEVKNMSYCPKCGFHLENEATRSRTHSAVRNEPEVRVKAEQKETKPIVTVSPDKQAEMIANLWSKTQADTEICKEALEQTGYNMKAAIRLMQKNGDAGRRFRPSYVFMGLIAIAFGVGLFIIGCTGVWGEWSFRLLLIFGETAAVMITKVIITLISLFCVILGFKAMLSIEKVD